MKNAVTGLTTMVLLVSALVTEAREMGHYAPGVVSIRDLAVPPVPGFFYAQYNAYYEADRYVDGDGNKRLDFESEGGEVELETDIDVLAIAPVFLWSTSKTILGANYAFYVAPNFGKSSVAAKLSVLDQIGKTDDDAIGMGDTFVQPIWLGWQGERYDLAFGAGAYLPTGKYDAEDGDSIGLGFWTGQLQSSAYWYLDEARASALEFAVTYEFHGEQEDTDITPGDHVSIEYGYSQYLSQRIEVGISGYSQWQVEKDKRPAMTELALDPNAKGEVHAFGVEAAYWFTPQFNVSLRYVKEYEGKARFQGDWIAVNFIWTPVPVF